MNIIIYLFALIGVLSVIGFITLLLQDWDKPSKDLG